MLHEVAHGYVARLLGDPTAKNAGRLTLNPLKHVDPFGTVLLPLLLSLAHAPVFGYAKPVPINPYFFRGNRRTGLMLTGLAGPGMNLVFALVAGLVFRAVVGIPSMHAGAASYVLAYIYFLVEFNLVLMFFNLIPIPPFDGSRVIPLFLNENGMRFYAQVERYGFFIILVLLYIGQGILGAYFDLTVTPLLRLFTGVG